MRNSTNNSGCQRSGSREMSGMILLKEITVTTVGKQIEVNAPLLNNDVVPVSG